MRWYDLNWMMMEEYLRRDDRVVLPLGSVEQHGYLSLGTDTILAEKVALDAAEPLGIPVLPAFPFGLTPYFAAYPGTVSLRLTTYVAVLRDILDSLYVQGFRRFLLVNGHGGNSPAQTAAYEWMAARGDAQVRFHNWWNAPRTWEKVLQIDPAASHASWMENFPWTRLAEVVLPREPKPMVDVARLRDLSPQAVRQAVGDGSYGGAYERPDKDMEALWKVAVEETRDVLQRSWGVAR